MALDGIEGQIEYRSDVGRVQVLLEAQHQHGTRHLRQAQQQRMQGPIQHRITARLLDRDLEQQGVAHRGSRTACAAAQQID